MIPGHCDHIGGRITSPTGSGSASSRSLLFASGWSLQVSDTIRRAGGSCMEYIGAH